MKERPILMHARSINGILEGRKTQTRRIIKANHSFADMSSSLATNIRVTACGIQYDWLGGIASLPIRNPYGQPGDRLWVRETFYCDIGPEGTIEERRKELYYRADVPSGKFQDAGYWGEPGSYWKPSIHMPRWASRLTLEVTGIRVERVQDITPEDCLAEGIPFATMPTSHLKPTFAELWDSTNGKGAWERNDWCWVVDFRRIQQ